MFLCFSYKTREYPNALQACHKYDGESFTNVTQLSLYPHSNGRLAKYTGNPFVVGSLPPLNNNKVPFLGSFHHRTVLELKVYGPEKGHYRIPLLNGNNYRLSRTLLFAFMGRILLNKFFIGNYERLKRTISNQAAGLSYPTGLSHPSKF